MQQDPSEMARMFVDLWQEQMKQLMQDERYLNASLDMLQKMQHTYTPANSTAPANNEPFYASFFNPAPASSRASDGAATAAPASADEHGKLSLLTERLAICERRIHELERQLADLEKRP